MTDASFLQRQLLPALASAPPTDTPAQQAFRQAIRAVDELREQLRALRASQAAARRAYWQQVGPLAAAVVAARRALYAPLETALTQAYLSRAELSQVTEVLVHNARSLQARFGEDEAEMLARYAPAPPLPPLEEPTAASPPTSPLPPHEQAAAAQARRQQRARLARKPPPGEPAPAAAPSTKEVYRQLARRHHPDRAAQGDAAAQQTQTALMQRITAAYAAGDLAALLSLLAEADGPTPPPGPEADALLRRYTEALARQQIQLGQELAAARRPAADAPWSGTEKQQRTRLRQLKRDLRAETDYLEGVGRQLREPAGLRQLLRELAASGQAGI